MVLLSSMTRTFSPCSLLLPGHGQATPSITVFLTGPGGPEKTTHARGGFRPPRKPGLCASDQHQPCSFTGPLQRGKPQRGFLTYRYTPCYAMRRHVFSKVVRRFSNAFHRRGRHIRAALSIIGAPASRGLGRDRMTALRATGRGDGSHRRHQLREGFDAGHAARGRRPRGLLRSPTSSSANLLLRDGPSRSGRIARTQCEGPDPRRTGSPWGEPAIEPLSTLACILMRKDPPFDTEYIYSTYILERAEAQGCAHRQPPRAGYAT